VKGILMNEASLKKIEELLRFLYGRTLGARTFDALLRLIPESLTQPGPASHCGPLSEKDVCLIAYGDNLAPPSGEKISSTALARLRAFLEKRNHGSYNYLHILPFHPYSSDDGFSVIDYKAIDPRLGTWEDIDSLAREYMLVFDLVMNHGSSLSAWFQSFLRNETSHRDWYITRPADFDTSSVFRPRTHPLLTPFLRNDGSTVHVWTTFGADQVDYNFSNPEVLLEFITIFFEYIRHGARILRLDAIAYLWKEDGTSCIHHPKTHTVVKLLRALIDYLELDVLILTETNVPHDENISYYGEGDEAHLVYNFALPPLVLHAAVSEDAGPLRDWARTLPSPDKGPVFFNFLASHDGVGVLPATGLVDNRSFQRTLKTVLARGGHLSYKDAKEGKIPYEINCSYLSVVAPPSLGPVEERARAFLCCHGVLFALAGLPAVYFHSWIGSEQWTEGLRLYGYKRAINREKPPIDRIEAELDDKGSLREEVYTGLEKMLAFRRSEGPFAPGVPQRILPADGPIFALERGPDRQGRHVLCVQNFGAGPAVYRLHGVPAVEMLVCAGIDGEMLLAPHETRWIGYGGSKAISVLRT
jgi:sucrose phosphorylase